jgi:hypothetical protein
MKPIVDVQNKKNITKLTDLKPQSPQKSKESIMGQTAAAKKEHRYEVEHGLTQAAESQRSISHQS